MDLLFLLLLSVVAAIVSALLLPLVVAGRCVSGAWRWLRARIVRSEAPGSYPPLSADQIEDPAPLVIAIHGTFARDAAWTKTGSALHAQVSAAIVARGAGCVWHRLGWSEANRVRDRLAAIVELRDLLGRVFARHPDRAVVLIGHSHGGGIAIKAAESFADRPGLALVTLATPFLMAQPRQGMELLATALPVIHVIAMTLVCGLGVDLLNGEPWVTVAAMLATAAVGILLLPRGYRVVAADRDELLRSVPAVERLAPLRERTLVVSRAGDEADGGLKLVSLANGWIASTMARAGFFDYLWRVMQHMKRAVDARQAGGRLPWRALWRIAPDLIPPSYGVLIVDLLAVWSGLLLLELLQKAVGTRTAIVGAGITLSSSETPPGLWQHWQSLPSTASGSELLSHSQIYGDVEVLGAIGQWIAARLPDAARGPTAFGTALDGARMPSLAAAPAP